MAELSSVSNIIAGVIEELNIYDLNQSPAFYPSSSSGITDLKNSIKEKGLLHPITVRAKERRFEIVAGNRRYLACKALGWRRVLCHIVELSDIDAFEISLIENIQRRTLNPIEEAHAFKTYVTDFGWGGVSDLAAKIGKSPSYVDRRLGLLNLPEEVLKNISSHSLNISVAEELIPVHDKDEQSKLADLISKRRMSIKQVRKILHNSNKISVYDIDELTNFMQSEDITDLDKKVQRCLDKSIVAFRVAMNKIADIMETVEDNWIIYEMLMQHRNVLHAQIDLLIKQKKKI